MSISNYNLIKNASICATVFYTMFLIMFIIGLKMYNQPYKIL